MRRHFGEWVLLLVIVGAFGFLLIKGQKPDMGRLDEMVVGKDKWYELINSREKTSEGLVSKVVFNGEELMTADSGMEWYYSMVEGQEDAKDPKVNYKAKQGVKIAVLENKITDDLVRSGTALKVMVYDDARYEMHDLYVTTLPIMSINHGGMMNMEKSDGEETMRLKLFDNRAGATQRLAMTDGKIRVRGAMASGFEKKGFRMHLKMTSVGENRRSNDLSLLGMRQDDDWLLYAGYNDQEKVRNVFATNLWKEGQARENDFKIDNGTEYKYLELIMNDKYYGLYALGYPVDELVLDLKGGKNGFYDEFTFKKSQWTVMASGLDGYELKTNVENTREAWGELEKYVSTLENGVAREIREQTDMRTILNLHLFIDLTQSADSLSWTMDDSKNIYLTAKEWGDGYKWLYTPWDMDLTFGNYWDEDSASTTAEYRLSATDEYTLEGSLVSKLIRLGDEEIETELKEQYQKLRSGVWSDDNINEMIDEYEMEIYRSGAFVRDRQRWPGGNYNEADEELVTFREYVLNRLQSMDRKYGVSV